MAEKREVISVSNLHKVSVAALVTNAEGKILLVNSPWRGWEYPAD